MTSLTQGNLSVPQTSNIYTKCLSDQNKVYTQCLILAWFMGKQKDLNNFRNLSQSYPARSCSLVVWFMTSPSLSCYLLLIVALVCLHLVFPNGCYVTKYQKKEGKKIACTCSFPVHTLTELV